MNHMEALHENLWPAPYAGKPLNATVVVPGSKSLSNRYLILAALGHRPVRLVGLLRSRDTELMMDALRALGVRCEIDEQVDTTVTVVPPSDGRFHGGTKVFCGLAGTVMRFVPGLAMFADGPVAFDGDEQAYARPMKPVLDGLEQLGACIEYHGEEGRLPFTITPPQTVSQCAEPSVVSIDSSGSSQFISGLLLIGSRVPGGLELHHTGEKTPSLPHIRMTVADLRSLVQSRRYEILYIDYLQLVRPSDPRRSSFEQVTQISMDLHTLAQGTGTTVVALSQLSRPEKQGKEARTKAPGMHSLRQSGQIEQDADIIMFVYREEPNLPRSRRCLKVAKNKEGEAGGVIMLAFDGGTQTFRVDRNDPSLWRAAPAKVPEPQMTLQELSPAEPVPFEKGAGA